jgi:hypothetical protein
VTTGQYSGSALAALVKTKKNKMVAITLAFINYF